MATQARSHKWTLCKSCGAYFHTRTCDVCREPSAAHANLQARVCKQSIEESIKNDLGQPPTVFINEQNQVMVSAEDGRGFADYYGEFRGGFAWIDPRLEAWAKDRKRYWEWQNPGCIVLCE